MTVAARFWPARGAGRRQASGETHPMSYRERRCALRWPLVMCGLGLSAALVAVFVVLAVFVNPQWFIAAAFTPLFLPFMMGTALVYRNWPTGIASTRPACRSAQSDPGAPRRGARR